MVKLVQFIHGLNTGGAETLVKNYALNIDKNKFSIVVLCVSHVKESPYENILRNNGIKMIFVEDYLWFKNRKGLLAKFVNHFQRYFVVKRLLRKEAPEVLHTHLILNQFVKFARLDKKTEFFYTIHSDPKELWEKGGRVHRKDFEAAKWLVNNCEMKLIALHETMRKLANEMFGGVDIRVLNNGVDVEGINNANNSKMIRKKLGILDNALVFGHIGRFSKVKNQEFLVDVFREIDKKNSDAFLLMVGEGSDKDRIIKKLDECGLKGKYLILSNRNDMPDLLSVMDVFIFPSLYEGLPLSLVEAQIAKKPCFVSDKVNDSAMISNLVTWLPLEEGAAMWADVISSYKKPEKIVIDEEKWNIKKITEKLEQIYLDALSEKKNGKK